MYDRDSEKNKLDFHFDASAPLKQKRFSLLDQGEGGRERQKQIFNFARFIHLDVIKHFIAGRMIYET